MNNDVRRLRRFGDFRLDVEKKVLWHAREPVKLQLKEIELLCVLTENPREIVTKEELLSRVWADSFVEEGNLARHVYQIRKTFKQYGASEDLIRTVPRRGYCFTGEMREPENEMIVERRAVSETLIEIEEENDGPRFLPKIFRSRLAAVSLFALLFFGLAFWGYRNSPAKTSLADIKSITVLPFKTISATKDAEAQGLGLADLLITRLGGIKELTVRPISAVVALENQSWDSLEIGRRLKTDAVLEGTIYRTGSQIRVTMRLLKTEDGKPLWAGQFEKPLRDELKIQDYIALQVVEALELNLSGSERDALTKSFTESADAFELYQKGRLEWNKRNYPSGTEAERLFRNAIEKDPGFALAYVGLADTLAMRVESNEAYPLIRKALEIDPNLAEAHATLGFLKMFHEWNWREAETEFKRSIELNPNYATAHHWYATLLEIEGRNAEAKKEFERALDINPVSYNFLADLGQAYYFNREYDRAKEYCRKALEIYPDFVFAREHLSTVYLKNGEVRVTVGENSAPARIEVSFADTSAEQDREFYENLLTEYFTPIFTRPLRSANEYHRAAWIYAYLGNKEKALDNLEKALEFKSFFMPFVKTEPLFDNLRDDPRFQEILRRMQLDD